MDTTNEATGAALAVRTKSQEIGDLLKEREAQLVQMLPTHVNSERFIKSAILAVARNKDLQDCTTKSIFTAAVNAAELGLDFTPAKRLAYMVPFRNNKEGVMEAQFMIGYAGFIQLAVNAGAAKRFDAHIVYENDVFVLEYGTSPVLSHKPFLAGSPGKMIGAYTISWNDSGDHSITYMRKDEIDAIRARSKAGKYGPWVTDYEEMAKKTTVRRHCKMLPLSPDVYDDSPFVRAIEHDNNVEGVVDGGITMKPGEKRTDSLADLIGSQDIATSEDAEYEDVNSDAEDNDAPTVTGKQSGKKGESFLKPDSLPDRSKKSGRTNVAAEDEAGSPDMFNDDTAEQPE